jgi:hypothetical protein
LLTFPFAAERPNAFRIVPPNDLMAVALLPIYEASLEFKAAAESRAAPYDNFISQLTLDCESKLSRYVIVNLGQIVKTEPQQSNTFR